MLRRLVWALDLVLIVNGIVMLALPAWWYGAVPGVADTGPFNPHFVRDIGAAYLAAGGGLGWFLLQPAARPAAVAGAAFLSLHALIHLWDWAAGRESLVHLLRDVPAVIVPGLLILWLVRPHPSTPEENRYAELADAAADRRLRKGL
jgi:uncharacterized protein YjeT (DUF2065 family)